MDTNMLYFNQNKKGEKNNMRNMIETVHYYEDLRRLSELERCDNLEIVAITKRMNEYNQNDKINYHLLKDLQYYDGLLKAEEELVICIKDIIYAVGNDDQTRITIKIREGECFKVIDYSNNTITIKSFNDRLTIRMAKNTFRYYFGVINSKGKSIKEFFTSRIFREMDNCNEN